MTTLRPFADTLNVFDSNMDTLIAKKGLSKVFPDPIAYTDKDGVERFKEGTDDDEKFLTSRLVDVTKYPHGLPFSTNNSNCKKCEQICKMQWMSETKSIIFGKEVEIRWPI